MNNPPTTVVKSRVNDITLEICHGEILDVYRLLRFGPNKLIEPELPDTKVTDEEFQEWLNLYRDAYRWSANYLLEEAQCN